MFRGLVKLFPLLLVAAAIIAPLMLGVWAGIACYGAVCAALHGGFMACLAGGVTGLLVFSAVVSILYFMENSVCAAISGVRNMGIFALFLLLLLSCR